MQIIGPLRNNPKQVSKNYNNFFDNQINIDTFSLNQPQCRFSRNVRLCVVPSPGIQNRMVCILLVKERIAKIAKLGNPYKTLFGLLFRVCNCLVFFGQINWFPIRTISVLAPKPYNNLTFRPKIEYLYIFYYYVTCPLSAALPCQRAKLC